MEAISREIFRILFGLRDFKPEQVIETDVNSSLYGFSADSLAMSLCCPVIHSYFLLVE
jgi:hypothetical protein